MLRLLASKYGLALHLAVLAAVPVALTPLFPADDVAFALMPLTALAAAWVVTAPSVRAGESPATARARALRAMLSDPVLWTFAAVALFAVVRAVNGGVATVYDPEQEVWSVAEPAFPCLPSSAGGAGFAPAVAAVATFVLVAGVRHGLGAAARTWFGLAGAFLSAVGGWAAVAAAYLGVPDCERLAQVDFTSPVFAGSAFSAWLFAGCACGFAAVERRWSWASVPFALAVGGNAAAVLLFMPPLGAMAVLGAFAAFAAACLLRLHFAAAPRTFFRAAALSACGALSAGALCFLPWRPAVTDAKEAGLSAEKAFPIEREDEAETLAALAHAMWTANPWLGVGEGAFPLQVPFFAAEGDWATLPRDPETPRCGYRTLLAERGLAGLTALALALGALVYGWGRGLAGALVQAREDSDGRREYWCALLDPRAVAGLFALACAAVDLSFSSAFRNAAFPLSVAVVTALAGVSFVKMKSAPKE